MSFNLTSRRHRFERPAWSGTAFLVEAIVLLVFLAAAAAIFVQLYTHAASQANESRDLSRAIALAQDTAERFSADPTAFVGGSGNAESPDPSGDFVISYSTTTDEADAGTLYQATISVWDAEDRFAENPVGAELAREPLISITTARYVGGDGR